MDPNSSYNLEMRIVGPNCRAKWFSVNEVVDADRTLLTGLMEDLVDKYPPSYGDVATLFYWCMHSKVHIPVRNDQEMLAMFEKNRATRTCLLTVAYHSPGTQPVLPDWESGSPRKSVEPPFTPSIVSPSIAEPSQPSMSQPPKPSQLEFLANPNPMNEHMGIDDEGLYIDLGPNHPPPPPTSSQSQEGSKEREEEIDESSDEEVADRDEECAESGSDDETSDEEDEEVEIDESSDEEVADREPEQFPDVEYDKDDPPMTVGTIYPDMASFKIALASHAVKHEFNYEIDKSDTGRYTVHCSLRNEGCPWRLHASTSADGHGIQVMC